jgi:hypothetical protein
MAVLRVEVRTDNSAFAPDAGQETARILRTLADRVEQGDTEGILRDGNGANVGGFGTEETD